MSILVIKDLICYDSKGSVATFEKNESRNINYGYRLRNFE